MNILANNIVKTRIFVENTSTSDYSFDIGMEFSSVGKESVFLVLFDKNVLSGSISEFNINWQTTDEDVGIWNAKITIGDYGSGDWLNTYDSAIYISAINIYTLSADITNMTFSEV